MTIIWQNGQQPKAAVFVQPGNVDAKYADSHKQQYEKEPCKGVLVFYNMFFISNLKKQIVCI